MSVEQWIKTFDEALVAGDSAAAADLFADDGYWRDLVAFTWNIKTVEGPAGVQDMLDATLAQRAAERLGGERAAEHGRRRDRRLARRSRPRSGVAEGTCGCVRTARPGRC